jgi:hypothetical protein
MESTMTEQNETRRPTAQSAPEPVRTQPADPADEVSIFSAPGMEAVMQWWVESNQRWERARLERPA